MAVEAIRAAAVALLASLDEATRARVKARFDTPDHHEWTYLPGERPGVTLAELTAEQRRHVLDLVEAGCSERGARDTREVMWTEAIRWRLAQTEPGAEGRDELDDQAYYVRVLGDPDGVEPWAWRLNGHHLALHLTVVGGELAATPQFFGANPATVLDGPHRGRRTLAPEEDLGRDLLRALEPGQREIAVADPVAPRDILTRYDPVADPKRLHRGLPYGELADDQRQLLTLLIGQYVGRVTEAAALGAWQDITAAGIERVTFTWAGGEEHGEGHYYAVSGPTFLIEYDNTQQQANHIHSVWRDLRNDWGADLLALHYRAFGHG
jgi:hypothetical protein